MNELRIVCSLYLLGIIVASAGSYVGIVAGALCVAALLGGVAMRRDEVVLPALALLLLVVSTQVQLDNFFSYAAATYVAALSLPVVAVMAVVPGVRKGSAREHGISLAIPFAAIAIVVTVFYVLITNELYRLYFFGSDTIFQIMVFAGLITICFFVVYDLLR